jgi:hypothetical protein
MKRIKRFIGIVRKYCSKGDFHAQEKPDKHFFTGHMIVGSFK